MRLSFTGLAIFVTAALPLSAALDFSGSGNRGTIGKAPATFNFSPSGGSGNYTFSYTPLTTPIAGFRVMNAPEASTGGALAGVPLTTGLLSATIRLTVNSKSKFID